MEETFSTQSVPRCYNQNQSAVAVTELLRFSLCELLLLELVDEAGDSSGTQRKGKVRRWKPLPSYGSEGVTVDTSVCVCVCVTVNSEV
jgi:hypothetical protein